MISTAFVDIVKDSLILNRTNNHYFYLVNYEFFASLIKKPLKPLFLQVYQLYFFHRLDTKTQDM